jgi:hypothetical protein
LTLAAESREVDPDPIALLERSLAEGWGDGLPVVPPTDERVLAALAHSPHPPDEVLGMVPPRFGAATVESIAINAVLAGVAPESFPLVLRAIQGVLAEDFAAVAITTTTSGAHPVVIVNGPSRDRLGIDYQGGCLGGAAGRGSSTIGRAVSLVLRNVGGQRANATTKSVFGQPARLGGLCFGEWEERSPWPSLAERRGFDKGDEVVSVHAAIGTHAMYDDHNTEAEAKAYMLAKGMCYLCNSCIQSGSPTGEFVLLINPVHAERLGKRFRDIADLQQCLWENAWQPISVFLPDFAAFLADGHATIDGDKVRLAARPEQIIPVVCGGLGSHQSVLLNSFGHSLMQSGVVERS